MLFKKILVAHKRRIKRQIFFDRKRNRAAARNIERRQLTLLLFPDRAVSFARMKTEKRQTPALRKGFKVPAGVSHPVDLVKRVREVSHPGRCRAHRQSVSAPVRSEKC